MNVIILGDLHVGASAAIGKSSTGTSINSRLLDQLDLLDWTLDRAIDECIGHIIITGDIFEDPKPSLNIITSFISWLKKCQSYGVEVHILIGNHDILRTGNIVTSALDLITETEMHGVHVYKDVTTIYIDSCAFTLLPFKDRKSFNNIQSNAEALELLKNSLVYEVNEIPNEFTKILIGHLAIEGSIPVGDEFDDLNNELFCPISMFKDYDYVWMGHVHKPQVLNKSKPYVAHIGSMDVSNFGETDQKKIIIVFDTVYRSFTTENLPTRSLKKISINIPKEVLDPTEYVLNEIKSRELDKSIVKLDITMNSVDAKSLNKSLIEKALYGKNAFNVASISETRKVNLIKKTESSISTKIDVEAAIKKYADLYVKNNAKFLEIAHSIYTKYKEEK